MHSGPHILAAFIGGILLMWPLGWLFGAMGWPMFHAWGLVHGSWVLAFPLMILLAYLLIWAALKARQRKN
jgi:Na+-driven multidrug efflux pump